MTLLGAHRTARTPLDGAPVGAKLGALALLGGAVVLTHGVPAALALLVVVVLAAVVAALPPRATLRGLLPVLVTAVLAGAYQAWARGWAPAVEVVADLLTLVLAAAVVTATTPADRLLDALTRAARPLRRVGLPPDVVAVAVALVLRTVPEIARTVHEVRDAARARGLERDPRVWLTPAVLRVVGRARDLGEALAARGIVD
ncbi:energy-coupling factor transporter transmembrane component T [Cellulomonas hominis]|uniref:energy-coupling factor transporter transmembrane component T n=1 Tax=Cellulomonas hominis TaxID=156981 RepID=UPI001B935239|nr:energy-coupling factor transporter transmembrane component T [Cellulomonas hominis]VTR77780.1 Energy-coupling factor transporter transmembrane protein BioN [Cellulomonas hominis]